jgi:hypothetical protein
MTAQDKEINLLPKNKWEKGVIGRLFFWALNIGRYVVVFTELIVISAFLFRFGLDKQLTDVNFDIEQKKTVVMSYGDLEAKWRHLQEQLKQVATAKAAGTDAADILNSISQMTPLDTNYTTINITKEVVILEGQTLSDIGLATLLAKAQIDSRYQDVTLETVSSATDQSGIITFRLVLAFPEKSK